MTDISRRSFLQGAAATAAAAAMSGGTALGADQPAKPRYSDPDKPLNIVCVGIGGMGGGDVNGVSSQNIVGLCDVDAKRGEGSFKKFPKAKQYKDYRKMFADMADEFDAVTISTPDHMHFPIAKLAMEMGKHVYVQKPCAHTVWEAREMKRLALKYGVQTQMGNQGHATTAIRNAKAWIEEGALGDVTEVHVYSDRPVWGQNRAWPKEDKCPEWLDWNLWLGTGPYRPYPKGGMHFGWRGFWDYGCGAIGDMGCHCLDAAVWALDLYEPDWIEAESDAKGPDFTPNSSVVTYHFPARGKKPPCILRWFDGKRRPPRPPQLEEGREIIRGNGSVFYGTAGCMMVGGWSSPATIFPEVRRKEVGKPKNPIEPVKGNHYQEWIRACKGGKPAGSNFVDYACGLTEMALLGNLAIRARKKIIWDAKNLVCVGDDFATSLVTHPYRAF